jgi:hypothetical protein
VAVRRARPARRERTLLELDEAVTGLARVVERHSRMVGGHDGEIRRVAAVVEQLSRRLTLAYDVWKTDQAGPDVDSDPDQGPGQDEQDPRDAGEDGEQDDPEVGALPSWLVTTDWHQAEAMITALGGWVEQVYLRWPDGPLSSCWVLHPHAVEELWTLRCAWYDARTGETASWMKWQDWHDRQRPSVARRLREALQDCSLAQHADRARWWGHPELPGADTLPQAVTSWATDAHVAWPPHLSERQIADDIQRRQPDPPQRGNGQPRPRRTLT